MAIPEPTAHLNRPGATRPVWAPSLARRLARDPKTYWVLALALALLTAVTVHQVTSNARAAQSRYGETVDVLVARQTLAPGSDLEQGASLVPVPVGLVPETALMDLEDAAIATTIIPNGAIVTAGMVAGDAKQLVAGRVAVAVPLMPTTPPLSAAQNVLLVVNSDPFSGLQPQLIDAVVVEVTDDRVVVSLAPGDLLDAAAALSDGLVILALRG